MKTAGIQGAKAQVPQTTGLDIPEIAFTSLYRVFDLRGFGVCNAQPGSQPGARNQSVHVRLGNSFL